MRETPSRYDSFHDGETLDMAWTIESSTDGGATFAAVNLTSASITVKLRAYTIPAGSTSGDLILNTTCTKSDAAAGKVTASASFTAAYGEVRMELVQLDTGTADANTVSGYVERIRKAWRAQVQQRVAP